MSRLLKILILCAFIAVPSAALACTELVDCRAAADCEGWSIELDVRWSSATACADLSYWVVLEDENGAEVKRHAFSGEVCSSGSLDETLHIFDDWDVELCGTSTAKFHFEFQGRNDEDPPGVCCDEITFPCECPDACTFTPGFWKNHPDAWPVDDLALGCCEPMGKDDLIAIMRTPVRGDATVILAHHLIAAKLNVANGSDPGINETIAWADDLLCDNPLYSKPSGEARDMILHVKSTLCAYNELGCDVPCCDNVVHTESSRSWGDLKATFR